MNLPGPSVALMLNSLPLLFFAFYFRRQKHEALAELLFWLMLAAAWWSFFYGLEFLITDFELLHYILVVEFLAVTVLPVLLLVFVIRFSTIPYAQSIHPTWFYIIPATNWLLLVTNPLHGLFYTKVDPTTSTGSQYLEIVPGPLFYYSHLVYSYMSVLVSIGMLTYIFLTRKGFRRLRAIFFFFSALFPFLLSLLFVFDFRPLGFLDMTPFGFTLLGVVAAALYKNLSEYELRPLMLERLFDEQLDPLLVTDFDCERIVYANVQGNKFIKALEILEAKQSALQQLRKMDDKDEIVVGDKSFQLSLKQNIEASDNMKFRMYSFHDTTVIRKNAQNLAALIEITSTFGNNSIENIRTILGFIGKLFNATACLYNKKIDDLLITIAAWNVPDDYQYTDKAEGHICTDLINQNRSEPVVVKTLSKSTYYLTDPNVSRYGLETYLGSVVFKNAEAFGTISMVFRDDREFTPSQLQFFNLVSYVVSNEEMRHAQMRKLEETEVNLRAILENAFDSIWSVDRDFRLTYINKTFKSAYAEAFGVELREGTPILETLPPDLHQVWRKRYERALQGEHFVFLDSVPVKDNILYIEVSVMPIRIEGNIEGISFYGRNITEKYLSEQRLIESEKRLAELNAAKDRLFSVIGHDLRSPFNNIMGLSEVIEIMAGEAGQQAIAEYASTINSLSRHTLNLLENLLLWSRAQTDRVTYETTKIDLAKIVNHEIGFLQKQIESKPLSINVNIDDSHFALADAQSVAVIVRNLLSNAIKFSYAEGQINISTEKVQHYIFLKVKDFGCGMSTDDQKLLFRLDKQLSRKGTQNESGTGIGLLLCHELAEKNGGKILVNSRLGKGSTFTLVLKASNS